MSRNPEREGKYFEAIDLLLKGAIYAQASNNLLLEGNAYTSIGRCYHKQLKLKEALENYQLSLALFEQAGNISGQITILINMAGVQFMQKEFVDALETLDKAQVLAEQTNTSQLPMIFINKGKAYSHLKDPKTFEYMEKALALSSEGNLGNRIEILQSLAKEHIKHNEFDKAKDYLDDAYKLAGISQSEHSLSSVWFTTALYYNYINQYNISNNYLNKALEIARKLKTNDMIKEIMSMYVDNYSKLGNYKNALDYYADYKNLNDTIFNEKNIRELALMESSYEYEKEKKEYELQQAKNEIKIRTQRYIITGVSITTLLVIGLLFMYYRSTKLKKHILILQLEKTNREVEMREQEIAAAKLRLVQNAERDAQCLKLLHNIEDEIDSSSKSSMRPLINYFKNQSDDSSW